LFLLINNLYMTNISSLSHDLQNYITYLSTETLEQKIDRAPPHTLPTAILNINKKINDRCQEIHKQLKLYSIYKIKYQTNDGNITINAAVDFHKLKCKTSGFFNPVSYKSDYCDFFGNYKPLNKCILIHYIDIIELELIQDYEKHLKSKQKYDYKNTKFVLFYSSNLYHFENYYKYKLGVIVKVYKHKLMINFDNNYYKIGKKNVISTSNSIKFFIENQKKIMKES
jgi:hypothetical protein